MLFRTMPLVVHGAPAGAAVLIRDVTEVKRRDRALLSKDATIREIHHRVKNNLQTVAALLRLQARRTNNAEGREALMESVRRGPPSPRCTTRCRCRSTRRSTSTRSSTGSCRS